MLSPIGKMPKTHYKNEFCNGYRLLEKKLMVYNAILMETISVMVSIGILLFF